MSDFPILEKSAYEAGFVDGYIHGVMVAGDAQVGLYFFELVAKHEG